MSRAVYVGHIKNDLCDTKTLVIADKADAALEKVIEKFSDDLGVTYQKSDVRIYLFGEKHNTSK